MYINVHITFTEGLDFNFGPRNISFSAGMTRVTFNVTIIEDNILEHDERFSLSVDPLTLPNRVTIGTSSHTTITIIDDDSKLYSQASSYWAIQRKAED